MPQVDLDQLRLRVAAMCRIGEGEPGPRVVGKPEVGTDPRLGRTVRLVAGAIGVEHMQILRARLSLT